MAPATPRPAAPVLARIDARSRDLGGLAVRRVLPVASRRSVGPFVFLDHMGPAWFDPGAGIDVPPHPHIGLSTVTYLYAGELLHRDSLGTAQEIHPGDVNWMTAGRGIVHSERTSAYARRNATRVHGLQFWVALPQADEEMAPEFQHHAAETLPEHAFGGARVRVVAGSAFGGTSPVRTQSPLFLADVAVHHDAELPVPDELAERAAYVVEGRASCGEDVAEAGQLLVFAPGAEVRLRAMEGTRLALFGGAPLDGPRHIWWNFVASSRERIEAAKLAWKTGRFPGVPGDDGPSVPLPE